MALVFRLDVLYLPGLRYDQKWGNLFQIVIDAAKEKHTEQVPRHFCLSLGAFWHSMASSDSDEDRNDDICAVCNDGELDVRAHSHHCHVQLRPPVVPGGLMIVCDLCPLSYHPGCIGRKGTADSGSDEEDDPAMDEDEDEEWDCSVGAPARGAEVFQ